MGKFGKGFMRGLKTFVVLILVGIILSPLLLISQFGVRAFADALAIQAGLGIIFLILYLFLLIILLGWAILKFKRFIYGK